MANCPPTARLTSETTQGTSMQYGIRRLQNTVVIEPYQTTSHTQKTETFETI